MEYLSHQKRLTSALQKSRHYFTEDAFQRISHAYPLYGISPIVEQILARHQLAQEAPASFAEFSANASQLFDAQFLSHLQQKSAAFDDLCGAPLADGFWGQKTHLQWAELIADNCIMSFLAAPSSAGPSSLGQFDGASDSGPSNRSSHGSSPPRPAPVAQPAPITQINLKGATIKEAWGNCPAAIGISAFERLHLSNDWSPSSAGGAQVFHGTSAHLEDKVSEGAITRALDTLPTTLVRRSGLTQLYPDHFEFSGFFTSFSAIRSFLWAAFAAEVIDDPPGPTPSGRLAKSFQMRGKSYKGVLLIRFNSTQPAPAPLTSYVIPSGKEAAWQLAVHQCVKLKHVEMNFWQRVGHIHGQTTSGFPDVIHGKDLPATRNSLNAFPGKSQLLWQTAWMSDSAIRSLNANADQIYAISFELTTPPIQPGQPSKKRKMVGEFYRKTSSGLRKTSDSIKKAFS